MCYSLSQPITIGIAWPRMEEHVWLNTSLYSFALLRTFATLCEILASADVRLITEKTPPKHELLALKSLVNSVVLVPILQI